MTHAEEGPEVEHCLPHVPPSHGTQAPWLLLTLIPRLRQCLPAPHQEAPHLRPQHCSSHRGPCTPPRGGTCEPAPPAWGKFPQKLCGLLHGRFVCFLHLFIHSSIIYVIWTHGYLLCTWGYNLNTALFMLLLKSVQLRPWGLSSWFLPPFDILRHFLSWARPYLVALQDAPGSSCTFPTPGPRISHFSKSPDSFGWRTGLKTRSGHSVLNYFFKNLIWINAIKDVLKLAFSSIPDRRVNDTIFLGKWIFSVSRVLRCFIQILMYSHIWPFRWNAKSFANYLQ